MYISFLITDKLGLPLFLLIEVSIDYFTVVCLVTWPFNKSEAEGDLVMIETLKLLLCKFLLIISKRTGSLT